MTSILSGLHNVQQALTSQQLALSITQKNVANANNPHYTRQDVVFHPDWATGNGFGIPGVSLQAMRDHYLDQSISRELQLLGETSVKSDALRQIDSLINAADGWGLQQALSHFFNSFNLLSGAPEDLQLRQQVISSAEALTREFQRIEAGIQSVQHSLNRQVQHAVEEINDITAKIADLNTRIQAAEGAHSPDLFTLRDERQGSIERLSTLIDISYFETESGPLTITARQGGWLVLGDQHRALEVTQMEPGPFVGVSLSGEDITGSIRSGVAGGLIETRDSTIPGYLDILNKMAAGIVSRVNEVHQQGADLDGNGGGDFFDSFMSIATMKVAINDPRHIAAAIPGTGPGNNENARMLASIGEEKLFALSTRSTHQLYSDLIYRIGADAKSSEDRIVTQNNLLDQLKTRRSAVTGVDLNEEAVNIIKFQKAYQASARFANVLDALSHEILNFLGR
jgi:flagellar hook-associated protein 1